MISIAHIKGFLACFCSLFIISCSTAITNAPSIAPTPPVELSSLPAKAWSRCLHDANLDRSLAVLWEYPGIPPIDQDSNVTGNRGNPVGEFPNCAELEVTEIAWSETDKMYWVFVEWNGLKGWVTIDLIKLHPP